MTSGTNPTELLESDEFLGGNTTGYAVAAVTDVVG